MSSSVRSVRPRSAFSRWFLETEPPEQDREGFYKREQAAQEQKHPWWQVMCLTGVDYFSSLGYAPGIAFLAAGALSPIATLVLVVVMLFGALPMYRLVAYESPHGDGSVSMFERLLNYWPSKLLVLALLGFVATGFVVTITLSAADAAAHLVENPLLKGGLAGKQVIITLGLLALLGAVFLKGFKEAIGIAVALVALYLGLNVVLIGRGLVEVLTHPGLVGNWWAGLRHAYFSPLALIGAALLVFPRLALGMSGFETGVLVMPLIRGNPDDTPERPLGRIQNARKLLTTAALIMSTLLLTSSLVSTTLTPAAAFWPAFTYMHNVNAGDLAAGRAVVNVPLDDLAHPRQVYALHLPASGPAAGPRTITVQAQTVGGPVPLTVTVTPTAPGSALVTVNKPAGEANGRALAYLAHRLMGEGFGTLYDISTILILWFAGASAMTGLLNIVPRFLPRYGMAPEWTRATRPLVVLFIGICFLVTLLFKANVDAQGGAYATGVLAMMTSAAVAVFLTELRRKHPGTALFFGVVSAVFVYAISVTMLGQPQGLYIALIFIAAILAVSLASRVSRSTELRVQQVTFDPEATRLLRETAGHGLPLRFIANRLNAGNTREYRLKDLEVRMDTHLPKGEPALFLEVAVTDPSNFSDTVNVTGVQVGRYAILRARGNSVPNTIAAVLLHIRDRTGRPPHVYFEWSEKGPAANALRFLLAGEGDIPPLTHEVLRLAEPEQARRPVVHVGG
ncbi:APC family permease [Deinococcus metallilatus]|uniref:APC family permease n=1 Tax=Deinococcus metallilatus TaxID=1211322 RepID=A0AAJ5F176_9DEIO|nr:APC family permease [Deinococcus metallilatus]MBB5296107.1 hypothetical protein [Deinococcus metallilatus]QBY09837.1 APC family permease [Deinococcus metallilatus]RXJ08834.1 APC family permease [Deinococcus metallilatus]TLK23314.1 APC family permease [Deinococcus metallilatus]GMA13973.1 hypothetical protein GCM10025871_03040 [Deinococcus metallilatus]